MLILIIHQAMESHEKLRLDMEKSLARIPKELSKIERLSNVYIKRDELHKHADHVLVSIFTVLERIIDRLSRTWKGESPPLYPISATVNLFLSSVQIFW